DAASHGIGVACSGVDALDAAGGGTVTNSDTFKDAPGGTAHWSFAGGTNYNGQAGTGAVTIGKADAVCTVTPYSGTYDAASHGIGVACSGVDALDAAGGGTV